MKALTLHAPPTVKERGILFSGAMVRALLAGKKTQTRRAVKPTLYRERPGQQWHWIDTGGGTGHRAVCPYGRSGDRLWVRETWAGDDFYGTVYRADHPNADLKAGDLDDGEQSIRQWRPSLLMPRWASRLTLAVESIRVERAQDISDADIEAEGVDAEAVQSLWEAATLKRREEAWGAKLLTPPFAGLLPHRRWQTAWTLINGRASWDANPWVWVVSFRRLP